MRRLSKEQCQELATALLAKVRAILPEQTPEWTQFNESDPGITLIEVFAFLTENLLYRNPPRRAAFQQRLANAVHASAGDDEPQRENFFTGMRLNEEDFRQEFIYFLRTPRCWKCVLLGAGIVTGLQVSEDRRGKCVYVQQGIALDPRGKYVYGWPHLAPLPARGKALLLQLLFAGRGSRHLRLCRRALSRAANSCSPVSRRRLRSCWRRGFRRMPCLMCGPSRMAKQLRSRH